MNFGVMDQTGMSKFVYLDVYLVTSVCSFLKTIKAL